MAEDRRIRYTKASLKGALLELLKVKPLSKVTVKELCELADVNRGTFYAHFKSPEELMAAIHKEFTDGLFLHMNNALKSAEADQQQAAMTGILEYILANRSLCQILIGSFESMDFLRSAVSTIYNEYSPEWLGSISGSPTGDFVFTFITHGCIGIIREWLNSTVPADPSHVAALILNITRKGLEIFG